MDRVFRLYPGYFVSVKYARPDTDIYSRMVQGYGDIYFDDYYKKFYPYDIDILFYS